jgi:hypothetical protein
VDESFGMNPTQPMLEYGELTRAIADDSKLLYITFV